MRHGAGDKLGRHALPAPIAHLVRTTYADATGHIFVIAAVVSLVALAAILLIKEVPLRRQSGTELAAGTDTAGTEVVAGTEPPQSAGARTGTEVGAGAPGGRG